MAPLGVLKDAIMLHWSWIFNVKLGYSCIPGMGGPTDMEHGTKGYDLDLGFSRSNFEIAVSQEWEARLTWKKGMWVDRMLNSHCDIELWPHPWPWPWIFKVNFWNSCISGTGEPINMERKGYESIGCYTYYVTLSYDFDLGFWRSNFKKALP